MAKIDYKEFRHGFYVKINDKKDAVIIKERVHYTNGDYTDRLNIMYDVKRPFYVTKKIYRNHKQKKEWEEKGKLDKFIATDATLPTLALQKVGQRKFKSPSMRDVNKSPYLYGCNVDVLTLIKDQYSRQVKNPTPLTITYMDIENDIDTKEISIVSAVWRDFKDNKRIHIYAVINTNSFDKKFHTRIEENIKRELLENLPDNLPKTLDPKDFEFHFKIVNDDLTLITTFFKFMHILGPDILTAWNAIHDFGTMAARLIKHGIQPKEIFSDPQVPPELRRFFIKEDKAIKVTQSGKTTPIDPEKRWHLFRAPAKFYMLDFMATFYYNKRGGKEVPGGYGLENILRNKFGFGKLKFKEVTGLTDGEWHKYMMKYEPIKYFAYNLWDSIGLLAINDETTDLDFMLPTLIEKSLFEYYATSSKTLTDDMYFFALKKDKVLGNGITGESWPGSLGRDDWTVTLHPWKRYNAEDYVFEDCKLPTYIGYGTGDNDVVSAYPNATILLGLSKQSTAREVVSVDGKTTTQLKRWLPNLLLGSIGATGFVRNMHNGASYMDAYKSTISNS